MFVRVQEAAEAENEFGDGSDGDVAAALERRFAARREAGESLQSRRVARQAPAEEEPEELEASADADDDELPDEEVDADPADADPDEEADDEGQPLTLGRLAKHWEMDESAVAKAIMVADPEGNLVPLESALSAWRAPAPEREALTKDLGELARFRQVDQQRQQNYEAGMQELHTMTAALMEDLRGGQEPDWKALAEHNPTEFSVQRLQWEQREKRINGVLGALRAHQEAKARREDEQWQEYKRDQARRLQAAVPEWKDPAKFRTDFEAMALYLRNSAGLSDQEIEVLADHRNWLIVRKAMAYDARATKQGALEKKLKTVPRVPTLRPGVQPASGTPRKTRELARNEERAMSALQKSGSIKDAESLVLARLARSRADRARSRRGRP